MLLRESVVAVDRIVPVCIGVTGGVAVIPVIPVCEADRRYFTVSIIFDTLQMLRFEIGPVAFIEASIVVECGKGVRVHLLRHLNRTSPPEIIVVVDGRFAGFSAFGCYQDNTERCT